MPPPLLLLVWKSESREVVPAPVGGEAVGEEEEGGKGDSTRSSRASLTAMSSRVLGRGAESATWFSGFGVFGGVGDWDSGWVGRGVR